MEILFRHLDFGGYGILSISTGRSKMPDELPSPTLDREPTTNIVAAYVRRNQIGADQLPVLISTVHQALATLGKPVTGLDRERIELDDQFYGGISWTNREITQMWYPSSGFHERQGIIVGAYVWTAQIGEVFAASTPARRLETALVSGERVHPGYRDEVADGVSVAWSKIPFNR